MLHHERARQLRRVPSKAQQVLWYFLRKRYLNNSKFRREHPIGPYIVDFICLAKKLIIEIDGGQHAAQSGYDASRTTWFNSQGFKVLRFWNNEVIYNTDVVVEIIKKHL